MAYEHSRWVQMVHFSVNTMVGIPHDWLISMLYKLKCRGTTYQCSRKKTLRKAPIVHSEDISKNLRNIYWHSKLIWKTTVIKHIIYIICKPCRENTSFPIKDIQIEPHAAHILIVSSEVGLKVNQKSHVSPHVPVPLVFERWAKLLLDQLLPTVGHTLVPLRKEAGNVTISTWL